MTEKERGKEPMVKKRCPDDKRTYSLPPRDALGRFISSRKWSAAEERRADAALDETMRRARLVAAGWRRRL